jgi:hypothetical protein
MRGIRSIIFIGATVMCMMLVGCDEDGSSPTGPGGDIGETATLAGSCLSDLGYRVIDGNGVRITSASMDTVVYFENDTDALNPTQFQLSGLVPGTYVVTPELGAQAQSYARMVPSSRTVTLNGGYEEIAPFILFNTVTAAIYEESDWSLITARITFQDTVIPMGLKVFLQRESEHEGIASNFVNGFATFQEVSRGTYTVTPTHDLFSFSPPFVVVSADSLAVNVAFSAIYTGDGAYTISGKIVESNGNDTKSSIEIIPYERYSMSNERFRLNSDDSGAFRSPQFPRGVYTVAVHCSPPHGSGRYDVQEFKVLLDDHDIDLGEISFTYDGALYYHVSGMTRDADGAGIDGVILTVDGVSGLLPHERHWLRTESDSDGSFQLGRPNSFHTREDLTLTITPDKEGWLFTPTSTEIIYACEEHVAYENLIVPDFIGTPVTMIPYFPLTSGASWTYARAIDGVVSDPVTVNAGVPFDAGGQSYIPLSGSMMSDWMGFRVDSAKVYAWNGRDAVIYAALDETSWDMGKVGIYPATGTRLESEDVTVPAGTFTDCEVIEISIAYGETTSESTTIWFAEDVGPVKMAFTTISRGVQIGLITDELTAYVLP